MATVGNIKSLQGPHWHLDTALMVDYTRPKASFVPKAEASELVEVPIDNAVGNAVGLIETGDGSPEIQEVDLSGMHLGMGGWEHNEVHPQCWQLALTAELRELVVWAERALQSARDQFQELRIA